MDAGARSLKLIYQSRLAPKYDFLLNSNIEFVFSLLNSENENISGFGAIIIAHSCTTSVESKVLSDAGVLKRLFSLLGGSLCQRDASLESLATLLGNSDVIPKFLSSENGSVLSTVTELTQDKNPRTRLLACMCLIVIRNTCSSYLQDVGTKNKLLSTLLELLGEPGQVGDEASFALSNLVAEKEDLHNLALEANVIDELCNQLKNGLLQARRIQGILLALADLCSKLESCRSRFLSLQVLDSVTNALTHDCVEVRAAACICLRSVSRSVKNLSAGSFMNEHVIIPLVELLQETSTSLQVAALGAICNIVVDFATQRSVFIKCGGVTQLVQLSKSMESTVRINSLWALRNLMFLADNQCKEEMFLELSASTLSSLITDPEPLVQEQALALVRNLVDGCIDSIHYVFVEDGLVLQSVARKMQSTSKVEVLIQGMYVLNNVASGNEYHKQAVMDLLLPQIGNDTQTILVKYLLSDDHRLRVAGVWAIINLTFPSNPGVPARVLQLRNNGITRQLKKMVNDPCVDVKLRVQTALEQIKTFGYGSS